MLLELQKMDLGAQSLVRLRGEKGAVMAAAAARLWWPFSCLWGGVASAQFLPQRAQFSAVVERSAPPPRPPSLPSRAQDTQREAVRAQQEANALAAAWARREAAALEEATLLQAKAVAVDRLWLACGARGS